MADRRFPLALTLAMCAVGCRPAAAPTLSVEPQQIVVTGWVGLTTTTPVDLRANGQRPPTSAVTLFSTDDGFALLPPGALGLGYAVQFAPLAAGSSSATVTVVLDGRTAVIPVTGSAVIPPACSTDAAPCQQTQFDPSTGRCVTGPEADGTACAVATCAADFRCEAGQCITTEVAVTPPCPSTAFAPAPALLWSFAAPSGESLSDRILDANGDVVLLLCPPDTTLSACQLVSLSTDGTQLWTAALPMATGTVPTPVQLLGLDGAILVVPVTTPVPISAYDATTGAMRWSEDADALLGPEESATGATLASVLLAGATGHDATGFVSVSEEYLLVSVDVVTGALLSETPVPVNDLSPDPVGDGHGNLFDLTETGMQAFGFVTGVGLVWTGDVPGSTLGELGAPLAVVDGFFLASQGQVFRTTTGVIAQLDDPSTGPAVLDPTGSGYEITAPARLACQSDVIRAFTLAGGTRWACDTGPDGDAALDPILLTDGGALAAISRTDGSTSVWALAPDGTATATWSITDLLVTGSIGLIGDSWIVTGRPAINGPVVVAAYALPGLAPATAGWICPQGGFAHTYVAQ